MAQETQIRQIRIQVDTKGNQDLRAIADALGGVTKNTKSLASNVNSLKNAFLSYYAALGLNQITSLSDQMQLLTQKLTTMTGSTDKAHSVLDALHDISDRTRVSINTLGDTYTQLAAATRATGADQNVLLQLTELLINTFRLSGKSAEEASTGVIAISQAFASGTLSGRQLRSVLRDNQYLLSLLEKTYGEDLFKNANKGLIDASSLYRLLFNNQKAINDQANGLSSTFSQALTPALNDLKIQINEINESLGISQGFAHFVQVAIEKLGLLAAAIGLVSLTLLPTLITGIQNLGRAMLTFTASNPILLLLTAAALLLVTMFDNLTDLKAGFVDAGAIIAGVLGDILHYFAEFNGFFAQLHLAPKFISTAAEAASQSLKQVADKAHASAKQILDDLAVAKAREVTPQVPDANGVANFLNKLKDTRNEAEVLKELLRQLNKSYLDGSISAEQYYSAIDKFNVKKFTFEFKDGKISLDKFQESLIGIKIADVNRLFSDGSLTLAKYKKQMGDLEVEQLNVKLRSGSITLAEYDSSLNKIADHFNKNSVFRDGAQEYISSIGTVAQGVAGAIKDAFAGLENALTDFIKTGTLSFKNFTQGILDDIAKIIVRASIVQPLANGILSAFAPAATGAAGLAASGGSYLGAGDLKLVKGGAFLDGVRKFATGGIVSQPTMFSYGGGQTGLMGEAGTEAILPLKRGSGGDLGVKASVTPTVINIHNHAGVDITQKESTNPNGQRVVEILVQQKVREGIASGAFDKVMQSNYGVKRKGS